MVSPGVGLPQAHGGVEPARRRTSRFAFSPDGCSDAVDQLAAGEASKVVGDLGSDGTKRSRPGRNGILSPAPQTPEVVTTATIRGSPTLNKATGPALVDRAAQRGSRGEGGSRSAPRCRARNAGDRGRPYIEGRRGIRARARRGRPPAGRLPPPVRLRRPAWHGRGAVDAGLRARACHLKDAAGISAPASSERPRTTTRDRSGRSRPWASRRGRSQTRTARPTAPASCRSAVTSGASISSASTT